MPSHMGRALWSHHKNWASKVVGVEAQAVGAIQGLGGNRCLRAWGGGV